MRQDKRTKNFKSLSVLYKVLSIFIFHTFSVNALCSGDYYTVLQSSYEVICSSSGDREQAQALYSSGGRDKGCVIVYVSHSHNGMLHPTIHCEVPTDLAVPTKDKLVDQAAHSGLRKEASPQIYDIT